MKDLATLTKDIERDLLINIVMSVKYGRISKVDGKQIAKEFLSKSFNSYENIFIGLSEMVDYKEIRKVYVKYAPDYYREKSQRIIGVVRKKLKLNYGISKKGLNYGN